METCRRRKHVSYAIQAGRQEKAGQGRKVLLLPQSHRPPHLGSAPFGEVSYWNSPGDAEAERMLRELRALLTSASTSVTDCVLHATPLPCALAARILCKVRAAQSSRQWSCLRAPLDRTVSEAFAAAWHRACLHLQMSSASAPAVESEELWRHVAAEPGVLVELGHGGTLVGVRLQQPVHQVAALAADLRVGGQQQTVWSRCPRLAKFTGDIWKAKCRPGYTRHRTRNSIVRRKGFGLCGAHLSAACTGR